MGTSLPENDDKDRCHTLVLGLGSLIFRTLLPMVRLFADSGTFGHVFACELRELDIRMLKLSNTRRLGVRGLFQ